MSDDDITLGSEEVGAEKFGMLVFYLIVFLFLIFGLIGAIEIKGSVFNLLTVYILMFGFLGILPLVVDMLTKGDRDAPLDTVSFDADEEAIINVSLPIQLGIGAVLSVLLAVFMVTTGQAFLQPFKLQIFETTLGEAVLSGVVGGVVEVAVVFGFVFPVAHLILSRFLGVVGSVLSIVVISLVFMGLHSIVYEYSASALLSVFVFGLFFQAIPIFLFRSTVIPIFLHFTNNFIVVLFSSLVAVGFVG